MTARHQRLVEQGGPIGRGRPRALTAEQERALFDEIVSTCRSKRGLILARWSAETGAGYSTLQRILTRLANAHCGRSLRTFHGKPQNSELSCA